MRLSLPALLAFVLAGAALPAAGQWAEWDYDLDQGKKSWKELEAKIPPYPQDKNLVLLDVGRAQGHRFYVDGASISRGEDGVMRYTTVVKAAGGASNVTFEGMRCETREHKLYALGRTDGSWVRARDPKWSRVVHSESAPHHGTLFRDYFCPSRYFLPAPKDVVGALKSGQPLNLTPQDRE